MFISNADGSGEHALARSDSLDYNPSWSTKGDWIAFTSERDGSADLFRVHPNGTGLERLTDNPAFDDQAAFSPDEKQIVFVTTRAGGRANLWILDLATRKARPLTSGNGGDFRPAWSPNGQWIAFSSDRGSDFPRAKGRWERMQLVDLYIVHPNGSGLHRITPHGGFCGSPKWTADSQSVVAYCMSAEDTWTYRHNLGPAVFPLAGGQTRLVKIDIGSGKETPLDAGPGVKFLPALLPSGDVGYLRCDKTAQGVFYKRGKAGPKGRDLHTPSWSPDGKRIVFTGSRMGFKDEVLLTGDPQPYGEIFVMDKDGTHLEQLTDNQWEDGAPTWRPHRSKTASASLKQIATHSLQQRTFARK